MYPVGVAGGGGGELCILLLWLLSHSFHVSVGGERDILVYLLSLYGSMHLYTM